MSDYITCQNCGHYAGYHVTEMILDRDTQITALRAKLAEARNDALEEAAAWCEGNMMAIDPRSDPATRLIGVYTAITPDLDPRVSYEGKAYAAAIRAMKGEA